MSFIVFQLLYFGIIATLLTILINILSIIYTNYDNLSIFYHLMERNKKYEKYFRIFKKINVYKSFCKNMLSKFDSFFIYFYKKLRIENYINKFKETDDIDDYLKNEDSNNMMEMMKNILNMDTIPNEKDINIMMKNLESLQNTIKKIKKN